MRDGREWSLDMACAVLSGFVNVCVYVNVRCVIINLANE